MEKTEIFSQFQINVITNTVFIKSKLFDFAYTPANDLMKPEYKDKYRYVGGLQCDHNIDSPEYRELESWLCDIAEAVLKTTGAMK